MYRIVLDVETAGEVDNRSTLRVYDMGFAVLDNDLNIVEHHSWIISDIYYGQSHLMESAYYADKIPTHYEPNIKSGKMEVKRFIEAKNNFYAICKKYNVKKVYAFNATFDRSALNSTLTFLSNGFAKFFAPYNVKWRCIQHQAVNDICLSTRYFKFCMEHGFVSDKGNVSTSAETIYRYLTNNPTFEEEHTGLSDVLIEVEILKACLRKRRKLNDTPIYNAWRVPQKKFKDYYKEHTKVA